MNDRDARNGESAALAARIAAAGLDWIVPAWPAPLHVGAFSTTRAGSAQPGPPQPEESLATFVPAPPVWLRQVHGNAVAVLDANAVAAAPVADAAVTREPGVVCAVRTADCLPVLFTDRRGSVVGVAHAGWRGLAAGVLEATVAALAALGGPRHELIAWFGPAIGPRAFEVGGDVLDAFAATDPGSAQCFVPHGAQKWHADLYGLARRRLAAAGVTEIYGGGHCTVTETQRFLSYRRDRATGRMATLIWLAPEQRYNAATPAAG